MKKLILFTSLVFLAVTFYGQEKTALKNWLKTKAFIVQEPAFIEVKGVSGQKYSDADLLKDLNISLENAPENDQILAILGKDNKWEEFSLKKDSIIETNQRGKQLILLNTYINLNQWAEIKLTLTTNALFELYVDGEKIHTKGSAGLKDNEINISLYEGKHQVLVKLLNIGDEAKFYASASYDREKYSGLEFTTQLSPDRTMNIHDVLDGPHISSSQISASGKFLLTKYTDVQQGTGTRTEHTILKDIEEDKNMFVFRNNELNQVKWLPQSDVISYTLEVDNKTNLYMFDVKTGIETKLMEAAENFSYYSWSPNEMYLVYGVTEKADDPGELKRIYGNEDRIPGFRNRSFLYLLDVRSGDSQRLTTGNLSTHIHDFHPQGDRFIFSTSYPDYSEPPFSKQNLYELNLNNFQVDTIWKDRQYSGRVEYSPNGKQLLVQGGPMMFGDIGINVSKGKTPNNYDGQLYLYDLKKDKAFPITLNFKPAVSLAKWFSNDAIYLVANEKDYINLYKYSLTKKTFNRIDIKAEVISDIDFAKKKPLAVYRGTSISTPEQMYLLNLESEFNTLLDMPKKEKYKQVKFGRTKEWNFENKKGTTIYGRVYYPPNYDTNKEYPVIVYYYGGTSPVERSFGGRYPKNIWAANGYIVYVLQPSGATGFGQEFSALHVNGWGKEQADDIIEGTKKFLQSHPSADEDNVGAIGASYGGYTTMLLQTKTDLFKTAVAHAGISSITSYWGEGYWGYTYSAVASHKSYPWNNKELYVNHSPLYNADKFNNSILLLHGTDDTNVPVGESKQFYAALKILGKDVEMVLVKGQDHHILDYNKRIKWHYTIMSWFDNKLKDQPQHWKNMYPEKYFE